MKLRRRLTKVAVVAMGAAFVVGIVGAPAGAAKPTAQACSGSWFVDITWVNQFYGDWAQPNDDEFYPGSHALGGGPFPGIVGFAQAPGQPGFGDFVQALQAGQLSQYFPNCPAAP